MIIEIKNRWELYTDVFEFTEENGLSRFKSETIGYFYRVIDERLFFLSVIKYGIVFIRSEWLEWIYEL